MKMIKFTKEQAKMQKENLKFIADIITHYVKQYNIHVLRYDAKSSESIYLKFDYGVAGSLRISAHLGYDNLRYTFNLIKGLKKPYKESIKDGRDTIYRYYYTDKLVINLAQDIVRYKNHRLNTYGKIRYKNIMEHKANYARESPITKVTGFFELTLSNLFPNS